MADSEFHTHEFPPFYRPDSKILILGSFPSVKSREAQFYYGHPQNRFWPLLAEIFHDKLPETQAEKEALLERHHVALWDAIESCEIRGSSDASIRNVVPTDIPALLSKTEVSRIFTNGKLADKYYRKFNEKRTGITAVCLPSTSPANAAVNFQSLLVVWGKALRGLTRKHLTFTGRVQHIGFRITAFDEARILGLTGWVRNCPRVDQTEAEVQGTQEQVEAFVRKMKAVKRFAIRNVAEYECPLKKDETYFDIR
ncbi:MAG: DNA-deoxyinosine glycosylase [Lachnospiraceae bacterium]|jgi:hypoxanthine-DNA glycosylase